MLIVEKNVNSSLGLTFENYQHFSISSQENNRNGAFNNIIGPTATFSLRSAAVCCLSYKG